MPDADCQDLSDHPYLSASYLNRNQPNQPQSYQSQSTVQYTPPAPAQPVPQPAQQPTVQTASYNLPAQVTPNV